MAGDISLEILACFTRFDYRRSKQAQAFLLNRRALVKRRDTFDNCVRARRGETTNELLAVVCGHAERAAWHSMLRPI